MKQSQLVHRAHQVLPAGSFGNFDGSVVLREGHGSRVWDTDGNEYIDCLIGSGPMLLGHGHPEVLEAVREQLTKGVTFFANNEPAIELAEEICRSIPCADQVRYLSTGGEADMYAMRLARAFTGRDKIIKFEGGYHGMSSEAQMSLAPHKLVNFPTPVPDSAGIPQGVRNDVLIAPFNELEILNSLIDEHAGNIAALIVEPMQRTIPAKPGFLQDLREICTRHDIVLIFDEVVTGYRIAYGGAQEKYGVVPDLCTLGKLVGGGFPLSAVAGQVDIMAHFDKGKVGADGFLMQVGTLSGNPVASIAGLKTLEILRRAGQYEKLDATGNAIMKMFRDSLRKANVECQVIGLPSVMDVVFTDQEITNYRSYMTGDTQKAVRFNNTLMKHGIFKAPNKLYVSLALDDNDLSEMAEAIELAAEAVGEG